MDKEIRNMNIIHAIIAVIFTAVLLASSGLLNLHDLVKMGYL